MQVLVKIEFGELHVHVHVHNDNPVLLAQVQKLTDTVTAHSDALSKAVTDNSPKTS